MDKFSNILNKEIAAVIHDKYEILFAFADGTRQGFRVEGDCCSNSWIEHFDMPNNVVGATITSIEEHGIDAFEVAPGKAESEYIQVYQTHFKTSRGVICLEYRNSSNGYYGGYLEAVKE